MAKTTKKRQIFFGFLKVMLLLVVVWVLFFQLKRSNFSGQEIKLEYWWGIGVALGLMPLNWWLEFRKWQLTLRIAEIQNEGEVVKNSFFAGMVTGMITPNMLGNFVGRMFYFQRRARIAVTVLTLLTNYTQFVSTLFFGVISLFLLRQTPFGILPDSLTWLGLIALLPLIIFVFYFDDLFRWIFPGRMRFTKRLQSTKGNFSFKWKILFFSLLRHVVFVVQFSAVLIAFGAEWDTSLIVWIWQYYFWVTLAPSLFLGKVIIRDSIALWVFTVAGLSAATILPSSLSIWIINLLIPTVFALIMVRKPAEL